MHVDSDKECSWVGVAGVGVYRRPSVGPSAPAECCRSEVQPGPWFLLRGCVSPAPLKTCPPGACIRNQNVEYAYGVHAPDRWLGVAAAPLSSPPLPLGAASPVHASAPVVNVPVLSKAIVSQLANASSTLPPLISMPLHASGNPHGNPLHEMVTRLHRLRVFGRQPRVQHLIAPHEHASARIECTRIAHKLRRRPQVLFDIASASNTLPASTSMPLHTLCQVEGSCGLRRFMSAEAAAAALPPR